MCHKGETITCLEFCKIFWRFEQQARNNSESCRLNKKWNFLSSTTYQRMWMHFQQTQRSFNASEHFNSLLKCVRVMRDYSWRVHCVLDRTHQWIQWIQRLKKIIFRKNKKKTYSSIWWCRSRSCTSRRSWWSRCNCWDIWQWPRRMSTRNWCLRF